MSNGLNKINFLPRDFFAQDPVRCARTLIGSTLWWKNFSGRVVETEAYRETGDPACHTFFRPSARAFVEKNPAGTAYVYLNYGVHWLLNVLVKGRHRGFVLIRALEPLQGIDTMKESRRTEKLTALCSGPGKLTQALQIQGAHHGIDLCDQPDLGFELSPRPSRVVASPRIGISTAVDLLWRFSEAGNPHVSIKPTGDCTRR